MRTISTGGIAAAVLVLAGCTGSADPAPGGEYTATVTSAPAVLDVPSTLTVTAD